MNVKTRFPPSPTGYLHIGGLRTALYNYYFAKKHRGIFVLRIEDTDRERYVEGAVEGILKTLEQMNITIDEGPYEQSKRLDLYKQHADRLIQDGKAYYCFCSKERLDEVRAQQERAKMQTKYDRTCTHLSEEEVNAKLSAGENHVIRMRIPEGETAVRDLIRGTVTIKHEEIDDQVLVKSDGFPTYHLAVVVDDHDMGITHVIRGEEWLTSTPKHILLYEAFGWDLPSFAHLPLILNPDKSKLSKRQGDVAVEDYLEKGYLPEALENFVSLLGYNPKGDQELYSRKEFIELFALEKVNKAGAVFNTEKLDWMNGEYISGMDDQTLLDRLKPFLTSGEGIEDNALLKIIAIEKARLTRLTDLSEKLSMYTKAPQASADMLTWKKADREDAMKQLTGAKEFLTAQDDWSSVDILENAIKGYITNNELQNGNVLWPLRVALSGAEKSPSPFELAWVFGKDETLSRIDAALETLNQS